MGSWEEIHLEQSGLLWLEKNNGRTRFIRQEQNKTKIILAIFRQNRLKDHNNIQHDQEGYFQLVGLHNDDKTVVNFHWYG